MLDLNSKNKDKDYLLNNYIKALRTNVFVPSKAAITDITSSGNLNLLTNESIKNNLIRYYSKLDNLLFQLGINSDYTLKQAFSWEDEIIFGYPNIDYLKNSLGSEILETLPVNNWELVSNSKYFRPISQ